MGYDSITFPLLRLVLTVVTQIFSQPPDREEEELAVVVFSNLRESRKRARHLLSRLDSQRRENPERTVRCKVQPQSRSQISNFNSSGWTITLLQTQPPLFREEEKGNRRLRKQ